MKPLETTPSTSILSTETVQPTEKRKCKHCSSVLAPWNDTPFCHSGCERVYSLIQERGLEHYYALKQSSEIKAESQSQNQPTPSESLEDFSTFDHPDFIKNYALDETRMQFYLDGVHCAGCVYLIEQLPQYAKSVAQTHFDFGRSIATVQIKPGGSFAEAARELQKMGYTPHPIRENEAEKREQKEMRTLLIQTGVAAACSGNLMLMAVPIYAGVTGTYLELFRWLSVAFYLPILFYSATPFYLSCIRAWKSKTLSIDVPIMLAIGMGTIFSFWGIATGHETLYFDSLSALVFLLLGSRYYLKRAQSKALSHSRLIHFISPVQAQLKTEQGFKPVSIQTLKAGDTVLVPVGERIPGDGTVTKGSTRLNCALLTGESEPVLVRESASVFAGALNLEKPIEVTLTHSPGSSRLGKILQQIESEVSQKPSLVQFTDKVARYFISGVLIVASLTFLFTLHLGWMEAFRRTLSLLIVTCPCALALATPLAFTLSLGKAASRGVLIKNPDALERLRQIQTVFFDKTGTLTRGELSVTSITSSIEIEKLAPFVLALESRSQHPVAKALVQYFSKLVTQKLPETKEVQENLGQGIQGFVDGKKVRIFGLLATKKPTIVVEIESQKVAELELGDLPRAESKAVIQFLKNRGLKTVLLSGDPSQSGRILGESLGLDEVHAPLSPEEKSAQVQSTPFSLMVGDGANDALALKSAAVGFATQGALSVSLSAADVYSRNRSIDSIPLLFELSDLTYKTARRNLVISLFYNLIGGGLAIMGLMNPLVAAFLMPMNATTAFLSTVFGIRLKHDQSHGSLPAS